ncbi:UNKNOWN [Stylonychia lemnae]|uniref:Uncharacterized protein n=1 Tax=Stylonychia lemnae TaxID=5949 RepID=A0A077ZV16_STYLE|nr:UNKNOWN [Stylonychia lemnae]|eukprot:CDW73735.1 UNKNOWN [Stylonychia lemnae]
MLQEIRASLVTSEREVGAQKRQYNSHRRWLSFKQEDACKEQKKQHNAHDTGMNSEVFNTEYLLKKKEILLQKISETYYDYEIADFDKEMLYSMFLTIREQRTYDNAKVNEIRPYFEFQNKIHTILDRIKQTSDMRMKVQDQKMKQCKSQVKDNKKELIHTLKDKINEYQEEKDDNEANKQKMKNQRPGAHSSNAKHSESSQGKYDNLKKQSAVLISNTVDIIKKEVAVNKDNFAEFKILSDQIDLAYLFEKYLLIKERRDRQKSSIQELDQSQDDIEQLKDKIRLRVEALDRIKKEEATLQLVKINVTANQSAGLFSEQEMMMRMEQLHRRLLEQTSSELFSIEENIIINLNERVQIQQNLLLKDYQELNKIRLEKENNLKNIKNSRQIYFQLIKQQNYEENDSYLLEDSILAFEDDDTKTDSIIKDMWEIYQRKSEISLFKRELARVKAQLARVKWCLNEQTNMYAYKLALIRDITETTVDDRIEKIFDQYRQAVKHMFRKKYGGSISTDDHRLDQFLKPDQRVGIHRRQPSSMDEDGNPLSSRNLKALMETVEPEQNRPPEKKKTLELIKQSFQIRLQKKIEIPLIFLNIREFLKFLIRQTNAQEPESLSKKESDTFLPVNLNHSNMSLGTVLLQLKQAAQRNEIPVIPIIREFSDVDFQPIRDEQDLQNVKQKKFQDKYMRFLSYNDQNLNQLIKKQKEDQEENQNGIQKSQEQAVEDKHISETHNQGKADMVKRLKGKTKVIPKNRTITLYDTKQGQIKIQQQIKSTMINKIDKYSMNSTVAGGISTKQLHQNPQTQGSNNLQKNHQLPPRAQSAKKPPLLLLQNLTIEKINTKETLQEIKALIQRSQSASSNRSSDKRALIMTQVTTPKSYLLNSDLKGIKMNQSSLSSAGKNNSKENHNTSNLSSSFASYKLINSFAKKLQIGQSSLNKTANSFAKISKL